MICPEDSAAKGCVQDSSQGIPTLGTGARRMRRPAQCQPMPAPPLPVQISTGGPPASGPSLTECPQSGRREACGLYKYLHPSTSPGRPQNAVWWCPLLDRSGFYWAAASLKEERQVVDLFIFAQKSVRGLLCARQSPRSHRGGGKTQKVPTFQGDTFSGEIQIKTYANL